jgi:mutator protein MutT
MKNDYPLTFNQKLRQHIYNNIQQFDVKPHKSLGLKHAAVAITIVEAENIKDAAIILTLRSSRLKNHSGQWALPGGQIDKGETPEQTALRELSEEVGLTLTKDTLIGRLDDYTTRSGYVITPVVVWGGKNTKFTPNPAEVNSVHRIHFKELLRTDSPILENIPESSHPVLYMPIGSSWIAAPTAAIVYQFREVAILGNKTRVAHFEQPYFAWK